MIDNILFEFDEDKNIKAIKPPVGLYSPFRTIIERDKGSAGDSDGRKKAYALKEFNYVYQIASPYSKANLNGFDDEKANAHAIATAGLPIDYKADAIVNEAIKLYIDEFAQSLHYKIVMSLRKAFATSIDIIKELTEYNIELSKALPSMTKEEKEVGYTTFVSRQKTINDIMSTTNSNLEQLKNAEAKLKEFVDTKVQYARGDVPITSSMRPRN